MGVLGSEVASVSSADDEESDDEEFDDDLDDAGTSGLSIAGSSSGDADVSGPFSAGTRTRSPARSDSISAIVGLRKVVGSESALVTSMTISSGVVDVGGACSSSVTDSGIITGTARFSDFSEVLSCVDSGG